MGESGAPSRKFFFVRTGLCDIVKKGAFAAWNAICLLFEHEPGPRNLQFTQCHQGITSHHILS